MPDFPPFPKPIETTRRCEFSLPGKKYDCRAIGKYILDGKGYCAPHYFARWGYLNPVYGQQHDWHIRVWKYAGPDKYESCRKCAVVRCHDGLPQGPCDGKIGKIVFC